MKLKAGFLNLTQALTNNAHYVRDRNRRRKFDAKYSGAIFECRSHMAHKTGDSYSVEINIMADERVGLFCA